MEPHRGQGRLAAVKPSFKLLIAEESAFLYWMIAHTVLRHPFID